MPQNITRGYKAMLDEANAVVETIPAAEAAKLFPQGGSNLSDTVIVDLRDPREIEGVRADDCIVRAERWLAEQGVERARLDALRDECRETIAAAVREAAAAPFPARAAAFDDVQDIGSPACR